MYKSKSSANSAYKGYLGSKYGDNMNEENYDDMAKPNQSIIVATDIENHGNVDLVTFKVDGIHNVPFSISGNNTVAVPTNSVKQGTRFFADKNGDSLVYPKEILALTNNNGSDEEQMSETRSYAHVHDLESLLDRIGQRYGWAIHQQAEGILQNNQSFEDQNPNALRYIADAAKSKGENELYKEIMKYLSNFGMPDMVENQEISRLKKLSGLMEKTVLKTMEEDDDEQISSNDIPQKIKMAKLQKKLDDEKASGKVNFDGVLTGVASGAVSVNEDLNRLLKLSGQKENAFENFSKMKSVFDDVDERNFGFIKNLKTKRVTENEYQEPLGAKFQQEMNNAGWKESQWIGLWKNEKFPNFFVDDNSGSIIVHYKNPAEEDGTSGKIVNSVSEIENYINSLDEGEVVRGPWMPTRNHPDDGEIMDLYYEYSNPHAMGGDYDEVIKKMANRVVEEYRMDPTEALKLVKDVVENEAEKQHMQRYESVEEGEVVRGPWGSDDYTKPANRDNVGGDNVEQFGYSKSEKHELSSDEIINMYNSLKTQGHDNAVMEVFRFLVQNMGVSDDRASELIQAAFSEENQKTFNTQVEGLMNEASYEPGYYEVQFSPSKSFEKGEIINVEPISKEEAKNRSNNQGPNTKYYGSNQEHEILYYGDNGKWYRIHHSTLSPVPDSRFYGDDSLQKHLDMTTEDQFAEPKIFTPESIERYMVEIILDEMKKGFDVNQIIESTSFDPNQVQYIFEYISHKKTLKESEYSQLVKERGRLEKEIERKMETGEDFGPHDLLRLSKIDKKIAQIENNFEESLDEYSDPRIKDLQIQTSRLEKEIQRMIDGGDIVPPHMMSNLQAMKKKLAQFQNVGDDFDESFQ